MLVVDCPWCGERDQTEFSCHGEAHIARPENPDELTDAQWGDYIFFRQNIKGYQYERWVHDHGCRRWFNALRHTVTDKFHGTYKPGDKQPAIPADAKSNAKPLGGSK